jgi:metallophosphoesterase (TIGR00282 family)
MNLLFFGDVVGRAGRDALVARLPGLIAETAADFVCVNAENAAGGFGLTRDIAESFFAAGVDCLTLGNHAWDQKALLTEIDREPRILRPVNYPPGTPGRGAGVYAARTGGKVLVMNVMGRLFMDTLDDPFRAVEAELGKHRLGQTVQAAILDVHAEATSEKMAMGHFFDGRLSLTVGTHTHVPSGDAQILGGGTAYQSDAGMCGDYDSIIGMKKEAAITRMIRKIPGERLSPAEGEGTVCGVRVTTDDKTGLATDIRPIRRGPRLIQA